MPSWDIIELNGFIVLGCHAQSFSPCALVPISAEHDSAAVGDTVLPSLRSLVVCRQTSWPAEGDETYYTNRKIGMGTLKSPPYPSFLSWGLKAWQKEAPAASDWSAFLGRCSNSCSWWPFSYPQGLGQVSDLPNPQRPNHIP